MTKQTGDETASAIEAIYRERFHHFTRVAAAVTGSTALAGDVVQEAFVRALRYRSTYSGKSPLEAWIWRILINTARTSRREVRTDELVDMLDRGSEDEQFGDAFREAVRQLPERQRMAIFLRYFADLDYGSIAHALNVSVGTVSATLSHAHASLRQTLAEEVAS